jgi:TRAP-type mannitol/chloroaromatic compound transport system substrate-binding protein
MDTLENEHGVAFKRLPDDVLKALRETSEQVIAEIAAKDPFTTRVYESYKAFKDSARRWHKISEVAYYEASS